mmetsp:Transcript_4850/g.16189  ORF Transcript_4850/g.16189 Transcript_4850/m.16189 type:complete len:201 (-) Transcript_4850:131-733(-)
MGAKSVPVNITASPNAQVLGPTTERNAPDAAKARTPPPAPSRKNFASTPPFPLNPRLTKPLGGGLYGTTQETPLPATTRAGTTEFGPSTPENTHTMDNAPVASSAGTKLVPTTVTVMPATPAGTTPGITDAVKRSSPVLVLTGRTAAINTSRETSHAAAPRAPRGDPRRECRARGDIGPSRGDVAFFPRDGNGNSPTWGP